VFSFLHEKSEGRKEALWAFGEVDGFYLGRRIVFRLLALHVVWWREGRMHGVKKTFESGKA
jgi:hypothetical protein